MTPEQEARLPRYAREALDDLRRRLEGAEVVARNISREAAGAWLNPYGKFPRPVAPLGRRVRFTPTADVEDRGWIDVWHDRSTDTFGVMGERRLVVYPDVTNVVRLGVET